MSRVTRIAIVGGGPGGYEAALVAAQLGAEVTVVDRDGLGGSAVLTDCVPSKTLIATAEVMTDTAESGELGVRLGVGGAAGQEPADRWASTWRRSTRGSPALAQAQSDDIAARLAREGVTRAARPRAARRADLGRGDARRRRASRRSRPMPCWSRPARTRGCCPTREPDGERILTWEQVYALERAARAPGRGRVGRDRRGVRVRLHLAGRAGDAGVHRATGCCPARTRTPRPCSRTSSVAAG